MKKKRLGFNQSPAKFPKIWDSQESITVEVNEIINKHVFLALAEFVKNDSDISILLSRNGKITASFIVGDHATKTFDFGAALMGLNANPGEQAAFLAAAKTLEKIAAYLRAQAESLD